MPISTDELEQFHEFALQQARNGGADSLEELVDLWRANTPDAAQLQESLRAFEQGLADAGAGRVRPAANIFSKLVKRYNSDRWEPRDVALSGFARALVGCGLPFLALILLVWFQ